MGPLRVALVTGSATGIGRTTSIALRARVVICRLIFIGKPAGLIPDNFLIFFGTSPDLCRVSQ